MDGALGDLAKYTLLIVGSLFPIVNPIGNTPIFLSFTRGLSGMGRKALARMIALNGLILIVASIFIGTHILALFRHLAAGGASGRGIGRDFHGLDAFAAARRRANREKERARM